MRLVALFVSMVLAGCAGEPHAYPESARAAFARTCPLSEPMCACTWDRITRLLPADEYDAALDRFAREGLMDPRISRARTECLEKHGRA